MAVSYAQLKTAWIAAARDAGTLDTANRALVLFYLTSSARRTADVLTTHLGDNPSSEDAAAYAESMERQDLVRRGYVWSTIAWSTLAWMGVTVGGVFTIVAGMAGFVQGLAEDAEGAGAQVSSAAALSTFFATTGGAATLTWLLRSSPEVFRSSAATLEDASSMTNPARVLLASKLWPLEDAFFASAQAAKPSRAVPHGAGPATAIAVVLIVAIPIAAVGLVVLSAVGASLT